MQEIGRGVSRQRFELAQRHRTSLSESLDQETAKRNSIQRQLTEAENRSRALNTSLVSKQNISQEKYRKFQEVQSKTVDLQKQCQSWQSKLQGSNTKLQNIYSKISQFESCLNNSASNLASIATEIQQMNTIVSSPEPQPKYETTGLVCMNGIPNCKNHPPMRILVNKDEIQQYKLAVQQARLRLTELYRAREEQLRSSNQAGIELPGLRSQLLATQTDVWQAEGLVKQFSSQMEQSRKLQQDAEKMYQLSDCEKNDVQAQAAAANAKFQDLTQQLSNAENQVSTAQNELYNADSQVERLQDQIEQDQANQQADNSARLQRQMALEGLARQELEDERRRGISLLRYSGSNGDNHDGIQADNSGTIGEDVPDRVMDNTIDGAYSTGGISDRARRDLHYIKDISNHALQQLKRAFDYNGQ